MCPTPLGNHGVMSVRLFLSTASPLYEVKLFTKSGRSGYTSNGGLNFLVVGTDGSCPEEDINPQNYRLDTSRFVLKLTGVIVFFRINEFDFFRHRKSPMVLPLNFAEQKFGPEVPCSKSTPVAADHRWKKSSLLIDSVIPGESRCQKRRFVLK